MNSFRLFLIEQENQQAWYDKVPLPEMTGNALMVTRQYAYNYAKQGGEIQETHGQVVAGRGYPLNKAAANMLSIVPVSSSATTQGRGEKTTAAPAEQKNVGAMIHAFDWLMNRGLYEALKIRQKLAKLATQELRQQLGDAEFENLVRGPEITEDMVYSRKAHEAIPPLGKWFNNLEPSATEPKSMIRFPSTAKAKTDSSKWIRLSLEDINRVIQMLNQEQGIVKLDEFRYGGPDGFVEWIEDGSWTENEKLGTVDTKQPWRTKHGVSLHDAQAVSDPQTGQMAYQFGGIISPLRNLEGSYQKKLRADVQALIGHTAQAIAGKIDQSSLSPEEKEYLEQITGLYKASENNHLDFNFDFSTQRGYEQSWPTKTDEDFSSDERNDYAIHVLLARAEVEKRAEINSAPEAASVAAKMNSVKSAVNELGPLLDDNERLWVSGVSKKYGVELGELKLIIAGKNSVTPENKDSFLKAFGVEQGKDHYKLGSARMKSGTDIRTSGILNNGFKYLQHMRASGASIGGIIKKFLGEDIQSGKFGDIDFSTLAEDLDQLAAKASLPKMALKDGKPVALKGEFGTEVSSSKRLNHSQIKELIDQGYQWMPDRGQDKDMNNALAGTLVNADNMIALRRKSQDSDWDATFIDDDEGKAIQGYSADVPMLFPSRKVRYGTNYVASDAGGRNDMQSSIKDMEQNPEDWGYGIGNLPPDVHSHMKNAAFTLIRNGRSGSPENRRDIPFADREAGSLGVELLSHVAQRLTGPMLKYGDLRDKDVLGTLRNQLMMDANGLPGLADTKTTAFWIERAGKFLMSGGKPKFVETDDYSPEAWANRPVEEMPKGVYNAFLTTGAHARAKAARAFAREQLKMDKAGQAPVGKGKEGDEISFDAEDMRGKHLANSDTPYDPAAERAAKSGSGQADTMRNRLGVDRFQGGFGDDAQRIEPGQSGSASVNLQPVRRQRKLEDDGRYVSNYDRTKQTLTSDAKEIAREVRGIQSDTVNTAIQGRLDAISDHVCGILNGMAENINMQKDKNDNMLKPLIDFAKEVCLTLMARYERNQDQINLKRTFAEAMGGVGPVVLRKARDAKESERSAFFNAGDDQGQQELRPAASTAQQQPAAQSSPNIVGGNSLKDIMARKRAERGEQTPQQSPQQPPQQGGGLRGFIDRNKDKKESYSFRTRYLRKLAEMAGATGAVYDGSKGGKDFEGNWEGAVGDPLGVSIKGDVEDRQSNPDGTKGKKRGKSKSTAK